MSPQRILAVLAAIMFVAAVGLATVGPRTVSLAAALSYVNPRAVDNLFNWTIRVLGSRVWVYVGRPLMIRPAWLPFGALGLILGGVALSLPARDATRRSTRRG